jgi:hypothetical protein
MQGHEFFLSGADGSASACKALVIDELRIGAACQNVKGCSTALSDRLKYREAFQTTLKEWYSETGHILKFENLTGRR